MAGWWRWVAASAEMWEPKERAQKTSIQRYSKRAVKGNTQIKPQMNECTEKLTRQATLKHKVWWATKANFINFTTRRSEAVGCSHESRRSSNAQKTARADFWVRQNQMPSERVESSFQPTLTGLSECPIKCPYPHNYRLIGCWNWKATHVWYSSLEKLLEQKKICYQNTWQLTFFQSTEKWFH